MLKQKLYAIIILVLTILAIAGGIGTVAIITLPMAILLFFSKFDYTKYDY